MKDPNRLADPVALDDQALFAALSRVKEHCPEDAMALANHIAARRKEIDRQSQCIANLNERIRQMQTEHTKELRESVRDAHAELGWQQRQGDEYGSY